MSDQERELKVLLNRDQYLTLLHHLPIDHTRTQINTYYDDDCGTLKSRGSAVRIRQTEGQNILTVKKPLDAITKYEYERPVHTSEFNELNENEKSWLENHISFSPVALHPIVSFTTIRNIINTGKAEISLDETKFAHHTDYEIEYEYRCDHDGLSEFNRLLASTGLKYTKNGPSKLARAIQDQDSENL